LVVLTCFLWS